MLLLKRGTHMLPLQERYVSVALMKASCFIERYKGICHATELRKVQAEFVTTHRPGNVRDINYVFLETIDNHSKKEINLLIRIDVYPINVLYDLALIPAS